MVDPGSLQYALINEYIIIKIFEKACFSEDITCNLHLLGRMGYEAFEVLLKPLIVDSLDVRSYDNISTYYKKKLKFYKENPCLIDLNTVSHVAAYHNDLKAIIKLDMIDESLILLASFTGNYELLLLIEDKGININYDGLTDDLGRTPVSIAAFYGHEKCLLKLIEGM